MVSSFKQAKDECPKLIADTSVCEIILWVKVGLFSLRRVKEQPSLRGFILGEINVADREKRLRTPAEAPDFPLPKPTAALTLLQGVPA